MNTETTTPSEGEYDWFFDIILNFLRSPRWKTPVMSFLDEHCIIFDNDDENKLEYTQIHTDFKKIVDELLCELMAELDITQEQFLESCQKANGNPVHKKLVDQILAVDNFIAFKKLMIRRNTELNEEALKMMLLKEQQQIQQHFKQTYAAPAQPTEGQTANGKNVDLSLLKLEQEEYEQVLQMSMQQEEERKRQEDEEAAMIKMVMEASMQEEQARLQREAEEAKKIVVHEEPVKKQEEVKNVEVKVLEKEEIKEEVKVQEKAKTVKEQPKGFQGYDLPPVAFKKGGMGFDSQLLKDQQEAILKGLMSMDEELTSFETKKPQEDPFENKSMADVLKEKREATEKILENTKINQQESMEERRARLRAHRDVLLKQKNDQRQQEYDKFMQKTGGDKQELYKELKEIDSKVRAKEVLMKEEERFDMDVMEGNEVDKRLQMYKNLRDQLVGDLANSKQNEQKAKMEELNKKISSLERAQMEKSQREQLQLQAQSQQRQASQMGFLAGIKSYAVEDI